MEKAITTAATMGSAVQPAGFDTDNAIEMFLEQHDSKESSRTLYRRALRQFFAWVQRTGRETQSLSRADVLAFRADLLAGENVGHCLSTLTVASYLTAVKLFYTWLEAERVCPNIAADVKLPKRQKRFEKEPLTNAQAKALVIETADTGSARDNAIVNLLLRTGMRCIEAQRANVGDIQPKGGQWVLYVQGKGRDAKDNFVVLSERAHEAICTYLATRDDVEPDAPLFACESNNNHGGRMTTRAISGIAKKHLQGIGLNSRSYTAHSLRHTFGCTMLDTTGDMYMTQLAMRHASAATTQMYTYHTDEMRRLRTAQQYDIDNNF